MLLALAVTGVLYFSAGPAAAHIFGFVALAVASLPLLLQTVREALRGNFATDAVAALAILTAIVLAQPIPGLIIVLMQSGGEALEHYAQRRATRALHELEASAPRVAHRAQADGGFEDVGVDQLHVDDVVLVRPGELIPADGVVVDGRSHVDMATITGEPLPVSAHAGTVLFSGCTNLNGALRVRVTATAAESQYERIVDLVRSALEQKAPIQRVADRYAVWFTPLTVALAAFAYLISGESDRVLAVLVVATPCPLILATPVAIIGGMNRAARLGFLFRSGAAIEQLAGVRAMIFDKTGTLTTGQPRAARMVVLDSHEEPALLRMVGAVELGSSHILANEVVRYARAEGATFDLAANVEEIPGRGVRGRVGGNEVAIGSQDFIGGLLASGQVMPEETALDVRSYIAVDGRLAGYLAFEDELRADLPQLFGELRASGLERFVILSGDDADTVRGVAAQLDVDEAHADLRPEDKVEHVRRIRAAYGSTVMIGDGTNDAPALAAADVGIAVAARGGGIAAETADIVLMNQDLARVGAGVRIAQRTLKIARQSISVGLGLSLLAMIAAAAGYIPPIAGALYQEAVDVAVILNALRAARPASS